MSTAPIRCFECGKVLGNKWEHFWLLTGVVFEGDKMKWDEKKRQMSDEHAMDELKIKKPCCRCVMKTWIEYD